MGFSLSTKMQNLLRIPTTGCHCNKMCMFWLFPLIYMQYKQ